LLAADHTGWAPSCLALRRTVFERVGPFDERLLHASDLDWFARAKESGVAMVTPPETLVRRRIQRANESGQPATMTELFAALRGAAARKRAAADES
jgi:GT2 family glycosyltransferase